MASSSNQSSQFFRRWRIFFIYCAFIYLSLPFAPGFWLKIKHAWPRLAENIPLAILIVAAVVIVFKFLSLKKRYKAVGLFIIIVIFSVIFTILPRIEIIAERIHIIEYIILSAIIYHALKKEQGRGQLYFKILIIGFFVGLLDEGIQYILPNRFFDSRDILLNAVAVVLGQGLVYSFKDLP